MDLTIIAAIAKNGVIGHNGRLPWNLAADTEHFRKTTMGSPVLVGRKTYENIERRAGGPLPGQKNVVLTNTDDYATPEPVDTCSSIHRALITLQNLSDTNAYIAGGESVYRQLLPMATRLKITNIDRVYPGDAYFPQFDDSDWELVSETDATGPITFETYERNSPKTT